MECPAERDRNLVRAVPTHFQHGSLLAGEPESNRKPRSGRAGMDDEIAFARRSIGQCKANPEGARQFPARRHNIDQGDLSARELAA